jgi:LacI family transcriptional regulator
MKNPVVRKPTQFDVARKAGVSQTTVSRILNNSTIVSIPEETRQRVLLAMQELSYIPDLTARSLRTSKTYTIAAIIPDITNPFYPTFVRGIQDVSEENGYDLVIYNTDGDKNKEQHSLKSVIQNRMDGLIVVPFHISPEELLQINTPTIQLSQKPLEPPALDSIYVDNVAAAFTVVQHLLERGYTRIGMIAGEEDTPPRQNRILGYQNAIALHHIPLDEVLVRGGDFTEAGGYAAMQELLKVTPRVDAVFAANDLMAMGALIAIREAGLRVPGDIAVAGMDNIPAARLVFPPLTTVTQFQQNIGRKAAEMLFERLAGGSFEIPRSVEMPFSLIVREST